MAFTIPLKKISNFVVLSVFCTSLFHTLNVYASDDSSEEIKEPLTKKRKLNQSSDSDVEITHIFDPSAPKPNPIVSNTNTTTLSELNTSTSISSTPSAAPKKNDYRFF